MKKKNLLIGAILQMSSQKQGMMVSFFLFVK